MEEDTPAVKASKNGAFDMRDIVEILLGFDDEEFIQHLAAVTTAPPSPYDKQEGPRVLQRPGILGRVSRIFHDGDKELIEGVLFPRLRMDRRFNVGTLIHEIRRLHDNARQSPLPPPETLTHLMADDIPPPSSLFAGLMHEGMLLLGGKSKRGKSWLMFDLAIALAVGRSALRHYACPHKRPVLYLALEDGRARLQGRAKAIQPNLATADHFHLRYTFPALTEGGIEALAGEIQQYGYGLVVIDVLARLEKSGIKGEKNYHEVYEMFAPLQELRKQHPFCLAMLTHLRKQDAEDVFDSLHGSVAYQGAQDVLWVLERKPKDDFAFLHIRDKDAEDQTVALRFVHGHWEYLGEGEEFEVTRDQRKVIKVLSEERREMSVQEILKAADFPDAKYGYVRKLLVTMVKEDLIHRTRHGKYSATVRAAEEMDLDVEENVSTSSPEEDAALF
jgi:AAA domain